jgi:hypothetical protein
MSQIIKSNDTRQRISRKIKQETKIQKTQMQETTLMVNGLKNKRSERIASSP